MARPGFLQRVAWALRLRCPNCGGTGLFTRWFSMTADCPTCGLHFERMPGYWLGAMILNFTLTAGAFLIVFGIVVASGWPEPDWTVAWVLSMIAAGLTPFVVFPWTRTLFSALELAVRPPEPGETVER